VGKKKKGEAIAVKRKGKGWERPSQEKERYRCEEEREQRSEKLC
jgi:hypothetical protein